MRQIIYMKSEALIALLFMQSTLQQQLIEAQQKIIELQNKVDDMRPKAIVEKNEFWHMVSGGMLSEEAANSDDIAVVKSFKNWNISFAERNIKPYVNPQVYSETLNQMTRSLPTRIAELETKQFFKKRAIVQKRLILDEDLKSDGKSDTEFTPAKQA